MKLPYKVYILKHSIEQVLLYPFIALGKLLAVLQPQQAYETYFFFPFYHTGGAEKVHAMVAQATGNSRCIIYFTRRSVDNTFKADFEHSHCQVRDISAYTDNKFLYFLNFIYRGILAGRINQQPTKPLVFNGQCNFGYKLSPWLKDIPVIELLHSFNTFSWIRIPYLPYISETVMISKVRIQDHLQQYRELQVPTKYNESIRYIVNGIPMPEHLAAKQFNEPLRVLYVGRGTEEKRVHLVAEIASKVYEKHPEVVFEFMGDVQSAVATTKGNLLFHGHQSDPAAIDRIYQRAHVVIITSSTEGFPLAIQEGMARGCAIIATPVGDIPVHLNDKNGFLFSSVTDEDRITTEGATFIEQLHCNKALLRTIGETNRQYAWANFGLQKFTQQYQQLFQQLRNQYH